MARPFARRTLKRASTHTSANPGRRIGRARGFTLIEVLVALAVFAIAMTALVQAGGQRAENLAYLRDRTLATWIAVDRITALRLGSGWPGVGTRTGEVRMAERRWYWTAEIKQTANQSIRRVEVAVYLDRDHEPLARVTGFLGDPANLVGLAGGRRP